MANDEREFIVVMVGRTYHAALVALMISDSKISANTSLSMAIVDASAVPISVSQIPALQ